MIFYILIFYWLFRFISITITVLIFLHSCLRLQRALFVESMKLVNWWNKRAAEQQPWDWFSSSLLWLAPSLPLASFIKKRKQFFSLIAEFLVMGLWPSQANKQSKEANERIMKQKSYSIGKERVKIDGRGWGNEGRGGRQTYNQPPGKPRAWRGSSSILFTQPFHQSNKKINLFLSIDSILWASRIEWEKMKEIL